ncbi:MAG: DHH family phosphoesterase [Epsilonproteobacteria bacterium]|nr:DHH family phosphoesterase [Campylobacterota bacterium]
MTKKNHRNQDDVNRAWSMIQEAQKVTLLTHYRPDGDGISACAALSRLLEKNNKTIETIYPSKPDLAYKRHGANIKINEHTQMPDLIIACDTANYDRLYYPEEFKNVRLINIDHHVSNSINGSINFINARAASTCDELFDLIEAWAPNMLDKDIAECLLMGILYDTQVFYIQSTNAQTLRRAATLMDLGANLYELENELLSHQSPTIIKLWAEVMSSINLSSDGKIVWTSIAQDQLKKHNLTLSSLAGFHNFLAQICGVDVIALFYETEDGKTKASLRSKHTDVNLLAKHFGGGGHKHAAGIMFDKKPDEATKEFLAVM